jgi:hypothetical protein
MNVKALVQFRRYQLFFFLSPPPKHGPGPRGPRAHGVHERQRQKSRHSGPPPPPLPPRLGPRAVSTHPLQRQTNCGDVYRHAALACLLACFKTYPHRGNSAYSALAGEEAGARFALLCQCSPLPASTSASSVLRSSLYCRLSSDLHSFRFCARRVLTCPGLPERPHRDIVPQW